VMVKAPLLIPVPEMKLDVTMCVSKQALYGFPENPTSHAQIPVPALHLARGAHVTPVHGKVGLGVGGVVGGVVGLAVGG
jgi:hypothetical protein